MLQIDAPFPNPGAKALLIEQHQAHPVRIMQRLGGRGRSTRLQVSIINREGSSGVRRVSLADLADATPLSEAEEAEYQALEQKLAGRKDARKADLTRFEHLRLRSVHAEQLDRILNPRRFWGGPGLTYPARNKG